MATKGKIARKSDGTKGAEDRAPESNIRGVEATAEVSVSNVECVINMLTEGILATLDYMARFNLERSDELNTSLFKMAGARVSLQIELKAGGAS